MVWGMVLAYFEYYLSRNYLMFVIYLSKGVFIKSRVHGFEKLLIAQGKHTWKKTPEYNTNQLKESQILLRTKKCDLFIIIFFLSALLIFLVVYHLSLFSTSDWREREN